jgi:hypothetical protein
MFIAHLSDGYDDMRIGSDLDDVVDAGNQASFVVLKNRRAAVKDVMHWNHAVNIEQRPPPG